MNRVTDFPLIVRAISESREKLSRADNCWEAPFCAVIIRATFFSLFSRGTSPVIDAYWFLFHCGDSAKPVSISQYFSFVIHRELKS